MGACFYLDLRKTVTNPMFLRLVSKLLTPGLFGRTGTFWSPWISLQISWKVPNYNIKGHLKL